MRTPHLSLSQSGIVHAMGLDDAWQFDDVPCGHINSPVWPDSLGPEPEWFEQELATLQDQWDEEQRLSRGARLWDDLSLEGQVRSDRQAII